MHIAKEQNTKWDTAQNKNRRLYNRVALQNQ
jgi:hypothetical protein